MDIWEWIKVKINQVTGLAVNRLLSGDLAFHIPSFELRTAAGGH